MRSLHILAPVWGMAMISAAINRTMPDRLPVTANSTANWFHYPPNLNSKRAFLTQPHILYEKLDHQKTYRRRLRNHSRASRGANRHLLCPAPAGEGCRSLHDRARFGKLKEARDQSVAVRNQLLDLIDAGKMDEAQQFNAASLRPAFEKYDQLVDQELTLNLNNGNQETEQTVKATDRAMSFILGISVIVMIFGIVIATIITGGLNKVLRKLALSLDDGSNQTASAAGQVSAASQSLAEGASEQASSLEETRRSLEETASMTKRNAE